MTSGIESVSYLFAIVLFVLGIGSLASQETARKGNIYLAIGMVVAIGATLMRADIHNIYMIFIVIGVAAVIGLSFALKIPMTSMPQAVAILNSFVGLAAIFIAWASLTAPVNPTNQLQGILKMFMSKQQPSMIGAQHYIHLFEVYFSAFIGAITFTGSLLAYFKLDGKYFSKTVLIPFRHVINGIIFVAAIALVIPFVQGEHALQYQIYWTMTGLTLVLGWTLVMAIGGADMPVVVSMLNSYSGWTGAATGFLLENDLMIVTGALVGSSGAILSYIMCKAMNRSLVNVIFGGFGQGPQKKAKGVDGEIRSLQTDSCVDLLKNAQSVVIVPGYGMAVARAQYPIFEMATKLKEQGIDVKFAIHPVAGRMPGHMNVLLAEANVPYDIVMSMDEINDDLKDTDVVMVVGANDIVNPSAEDDEGSPIYGMPVIKAWSATDVIVLKRSMATGYAGVQNPLFFKENTQMLFGDAKETINKLVASL